MKYKRIIFFICMVLVIALTGCGEQAQAPDPRLKYFSIVDSRILIDGNQAQVAGDVINNSTMKFPFDVTMQANLLDAQGNVIGTATGTAEDVGLGQVRQFILQGTVDGAKYARLSIIPISLQEKRQELNLPTPTPINA